ncbi:class IV adenylate cyclase [Streptomyces yaizuensis]|uniref:Class IV adenylate cyclase n=1 Tax=Streptomyces yaizuensis TaxID=2989713 RepID=A0ABQ5P5E7_9ACTN|nr:class IV adenylate cyclase [Streptomyces sp. YSPA8]GLF97795.1 class IV adenylate cyclase [Streptomyces sp. YSPA8]
MIEAELKARVHTPAEVLRRLDERAVGVAEVYEDTYYDLPGGPLARQDNELRLRTVRGPEGIRTVLTYKGAQVEAASGSKPECETRVGDAEATHAVLRGLGYEVVIAFRKECRNYAFTERGRGLLATLVRVPELEGTFLEVETLVDTDQVGHALADIRAVLAGLGIGTADLTRELYTDAVRARRTTLP